MLLLWGDGVKESISSVMYLCCQGHMFRKHGTLLVLMRLMLDNVHLHRQSPDLFQLYIVLNEISIFNVVKKINWIFTFVFWDLKASGLCEYNSDPYLLLVHIVHISYTPRNQLTCVVKVITDDCLIGLLCVEPQTQFIKLFSLILMNHAPAAGSFLPLHLQQLNSYIRGSVFFNFCFVYCQNIYHYLFFPIFKAYFKHYWKNQRIVKYFWAARCK